MAGRLGGIGLDAADEVRLGLLEHVHERQQRVLGGEGRGGEGRERGGEGRGGRGEGRGGEGEGRGGEERGGEERERGGNLYKIVCLPIFIHLP